jgi:putative colanic acid biosynthesis acetyltransferase WcaF
MIIINLDKFDNSWYKPGASAVIRFFWYLSNILIFKSSLFPFYALKRGLLRLFGARIGKKVLIKPNVNIKYPWRLTIGDYVWIGESVWIDNLDDVIIGSNSCLSQGAMLLCGNHNYKKESFDLMTAKIVLEEGVWIGAKAIVCPGVTCHSHSVLSVGSVATKNLEPNAIYQGNPAIKIHARIVSSN